MYCRFCNDESGQGLAEYAVILALVAVTAIGALRILGGTIKSFFDELLYEWEAHEIP